MATHSHILAWRIPMVGGAWPATVHGDGHLVPPAPPLVASAPGSQKSLPSQPWCPSTTTCPPLALHRPLPLLPTPWGWSSGLYSAPVSQGLAPAQLLSAWGLGGQGIRETTRAFSMEGGGEYLLEQQHRARLQLILARLQQQPVHRALHLSCKHHAAHQSQGQGQHSAWSGPSWEVGGSLSQLS